MKIWITKYALTKGILEKEISIHPTEDTIATFDGFRIEYYNGRGKNWHENKESAIKTAEEMRKKKIKSLKKKIEQLENMRFD